MDATKHKLEIKFFKASSDDNLRNFGWRAPITTIDSIILHYTVADAERSFQLLTAPRGVSSHYLVYENGTIHQLVDENLMAWHAGVSSWRGIPSLNNRSIGIEIVNPGSGTEACFDEAFVSNKEKNFTLDECKCHPFPNLQMESVIALVKDIMERNPAIEQRNIVGHMDIAPTRKLDPGISFNWQKLAKEGIGIFPTEKHLVENPTCLFGPGSQGDNVKSFQEKLQNYGYGIKVDGDYDKEDAAYARAFKLHFRQDTVNDYWDNIDDATLDELLELVGDCHITL